MVNGFRYHRALESVSILSALSTAFTIYPCQIRVHQRRQSKLQLPTAWKKEWRPATVGSSPHAVTCQHCDTHYFSRPRTRNLPIVGWLLVRRATSSATDSPHHCNALFDRHSGDDQVSMYDRYGQLMKEFNLVGWELTVNAYGYFILIK